MKKTNWQRNYDIFIFKFKNKCSYQKVASHFGISKARAKSICDKILRIMRYELKKRKARDNKK